MSSTTLRVKTDELHITFAQDGSSDGWPVVLSHGFPYDVHAFDEVVPLLVERGARVIRPYLRGFGPTSFLASSTYARDDKGESSDFYWGPSDRMDRKETAGPSTSLRSTTSRAD